MLPVALKRNLNLLRRAVELGISDPIGLQIETLRRVPMLGKRLTAAAQRGNWLTSSLPPLRWLGLNAALVAQKETSAPPIDLLQNNILRFSDPPRMTSSDVLTLRLLSASGQYDDVAGFLARVPPSRVSKKVLAREYVNALGASAQHENTRSGRRFASPQIHSVVAAILRQESGSRMLEFIRPIFTAVHTGHLPATSVKDISRLIFGSVAPHQKPEKGSALSKKRVPIGSYTSFVHWLLWMMFSDGAMEARIHPLLKKRFALGFQSDIDARLASWRESRCYPDFVQSDNVRRQERLSGPPGEPRSGPARVLIVTDNWSFASPMLEPLSKAGLDVRTYSFDMFADVYDGGFNGNDVFLPHSYHKNRHTVRAKLAKTAPVFDELINWADVVFVDWCNRPGLWLSRFLREDKKLVIRLHSYEAFSHWPYTLNWGGVDAMIFVADTIANFVKVQHGERMDYVQQVTLPNINTCTAEHSSMPDGDRAFVFGMAGYNNANKNPVMALEILKSMRKRDPRWHLKLVGHPWDPVQELDKVERRHFERFTELLEDPLVSDGVTIEGFTNNIADWFGDVGFTLSCSDREGTHEAAIEGMSRGCIPIVRNWPVVKRYGGPTAVYKGIDHLIFETVEEAVSIIEKQHGSFASGSKAAMAEFQQTYASDVVARQYAEFFQAIAGTTGKVEVADGDLPSVRVGNA